MNACGAFAERLVRTLRRRSLLQCTSGVRRHTALRIVDHTLVRAGLCATSEHVWRATRTSLRTSSADPTPCPEREAPGVNLVTVQRQL